MIDDIYLKALNKLITNGDKISIASVAAEAGRKRSAIRKDRHPELINKINAAAELQRLKSPSKESEKNKQIELKKKYRSELEETRNILESVLEMNISLELQVHEQIILIARLQKENAQLKRRLDNTVTELYRNKTK